MLSAATPPAWFPGAEWLVIPGLMVLYALSTKAPRPYALIYLVLCAQTLYFSWSLRHVLLPGWAAIGLLAGLYGMLMVGWMRALARVLAGPPAFALALAGTQWLRAHMVQFPYPHGQPAHDLYLWPAVLGVVRWGGEPLANLMLAGLAAAGVDLYRSWRVADPPWRRATRRAARWVVGAILLAVLPPPRAENPDSQTVRVLAIEPGLERELVFGQAPWSSMLPRLYELTGRIAGPGAESAPDLVLWPESTLPGEVVDRELKVKIPGLSLPHLRDGTRLLVGASVLRGERISPASVLLDARGQYLAHQEKAIPVPGGEVIPFTDWLPEGLRRAVLDALAGMVPWVPQNLPGRPLPPLQTAEGVPFGSLICFDNAFDTVVARHVQDGARFLAVLSNEAWYLGGGELEQMVAMTVFRALETGTPLIRSTVDGVSLVVDRRGRIRDRLAAPHRRGPPVARFLDVTLDLGPGRLPPLAWLSPALLWLILGSGVLVLLHRARCWARLIQSPRFAGGNPP